MFTAPVHMPPALSRAFLREVAAWVAGALFCAQMAVAAYACPGMASVRNAAAVPEVATAMAHCDGMNGKAGHVLDPDAPNLCAEHCKQGQQSDQAAMLNVPAAVMVLRYATPVLPVKAAPPRPAAASISALVAASPPHAIAHCVHRI
jgi:hypothetical protein